MRKVEDNKNITQNVENEDSCILYMDRVGDFLLQRQDMVMLFGEAERIRLNRVCYF